MKLVKIFLVLLLPFSIVFSQDSVQTFLSLEPTGVAEFHKTYPDYDGRGTIIFILDTGVDMGVEGLTQTTTGEIKVIDVQDFTGQGDIEFYEADTDEEDGVSYFFNEDKKLKVKGAGKLSLISIDDKYFIGAVEEKLWMNSGSRAGDLNGNGKTDDVYYFVTFETQNETEKFWVVYLDLNGNSDISDEKPIRNYRELYDSFYIANESSLPPFTMGLNIFPEKNVVTFHFDDGGHGTNCAGIAAGNKIGGVEFYGVAPGANVIGLKLGNNNFAGGATVTESMKKSFQYFAKVATETGKPCIVNMSFGIGSEIEGKAAIEDYLKDLTTQNPFLYICTSNGNEGPGISTSGMPAASSAVFSSGAILTKNVGTDMYAAELNEDIILHFSSRGGEVMKPDVVSPGASASTMPNFAGRDRMWGTSMASPYTAGVLSLLLSAAAVEYPNVKIPSQLLYKIIRESATPIERYDPIDQGGGYINVMNAFSLLKKYIDSDQLEKFETYTVSSFAPNMPSRSGNALYIRNGNYLTGNETYTFRIVRNNFINKMKFYRILNIKSDSDWLIPIQKKIHFRNDQTASVNVKFDLSKMKDPGLYNGIITALRNDGSNIQEFSMMATVVIPYEFNYGNDYKLSIKNQKVGIGELNRYFVNIPAGGTTMKIKLSSEENTYTDVWFHLHKPFGEGIARVRLNSNQNEDYEEREYFNLEPGIWELDVMGLFIAAGESTYNLTISFEGLNSLNKMELNESHNVISMINNFNTVYNYDLSGEITGYKEFKTVELKSYDQYEIPFVIRKNEQRKNFHIKMSKEDFNKVTDYAVMVYDKEGKAQAIGGLTYSEGSVSLGNSFDADSTQLKLVLIPGFTNADDKMLTHITVESELKSSVNFSVKQDGRSTGTFYPSISSDLKCEIKKPDLYLPPNSKFYGEIKFKSDDKIKYLLPIQFNF